MDSTIHLLNSPSYVYGRWIAYSPKIGMCEAARSNSMLGQYWASTLLSDDGDGVGCYTQLNNNVGLFLLAE